jgi:hypothetical protein
VADAVGRVDEIALESEEHGDASQVNADSDRESRSKFSHGLSS